MTHLDPRRAGRALTWRASAAVRVLPDFLIIGAQKAGTTSLYDHLCGTDGVLAARKKEVRFFDRHWDRGTTWYRWSFPTRRQIGRGPNRRLTGEATPDYLVHPLAPARAASVVPRCRLIVLLRDPVDRAHSQYRMNLQLGTEDRPFEDAVADELDRLARHPCHEPAPHWDDARNFWSYVERSRYHPQLLRWFARYPRDRVHVATLERLLADPADELGRIHRFLGLTDPAPGARLAHANRREYEELPPDARRRLHALFAQDIARTEELLGTELGYGPGAPPP